MNAQTERIREKLDRREALATPRSRALGQIYSVKAVAVAGRTGGLNLCPSIGLNSSGKSTN